jgi:4'-phosphopantetheinyl transferase
MGLFLFEENSNYRYGIWKMEENEDMLKNMLGNKNILVPYANPGKRIEFLSVRVLGIQMDIDPQKITYQSSGKPFLNGQDTNISISHTKGYAAILLSDLVNIGTDIECKSDRILKVRKKFMGHEEEENLPKEKELISLLLHWSAKESLFKAIPDEEIDFIKELRITDFTSPADQGSFHAKALRSEMSFQVDYRVEKDFVFTACFPCLP